MAGPGAECGAGCDGDPVLGDQPVHAIFIRAPVIERTGPGVDILAQLADGRVVAVRQRNVIATSFHPELTPEGLRGWLDNGGRSLAEADGEGAALALAPAEAAGLAAADGEGAAVPLPSSVSVTGRRISM